MTTFDLDISYAQLAVFDSKLEAPFSDWTNEHVAQGFAWRPSSVSFGTLHSSGTIRVEVFRYRSFRGDASLAERIILVPFAVPEHGAIEIASIGSSAALELPPGDYALTFEHGCDAAGIMWSNFYFCPELGLVKPQILRADAELSPPEVLVMTAEPA